MDTMRRLRRVRAANFFQFSIAPKQTKTTATMETAVPTHIEAIRKLLKHVDEELSYLESRQKKKIVNLDAVAKIEQVAEPSELRMDYVT